MEFCRGLEIREIRYGSDFFVEGPLLRFLSYLDLTMKAICGNLIVARKCPSTNKTNGVPTSQRRFAPANSQLQDKELPILQAISAGNSDAS
ncbi:hypothetical protein HZH66_006870 [Vespula vulgaris]|uniref:Uncharacterized protein n=1 Tax=Vespula vulgaris TaxID=7454 RepID=A0A834N965_VESVU|nr:hypothetical protein HZH66_006870 [Vespula vulgaris]